MTPLQHFLSDPEACVYLSDQQATFENLVVLALSGAEYEEKMNQGWRKFGPVLFHPICEHCKECRPIRICIADFVPDRSQKRALEKNKDLTIQFAKPSLDPVRLLLYNRYHAFREASRGWPEAEKSEQDYIFSFLQNPIKSIEISVWNSDRLCAIVHTDITPNTVSGVYHFYDPELESLSLGTFSMLQTIELARRLEKPWAYFGYYIEGCGSMRYKKKFKPHEILGTDGVWR
jgi:leucyl-tRNA---protein transferase